MEVIYLKSLEKDLKRIKDRKLLTSLATIFIDLEKAESLIEVSGIKKLSGHSDAYRIRLGDYRLGIYYSEDTFTIARFKKREDIYKLFP
jgi:mRNA-degrading endonuclease RelE of RelBE toxin-antitoxin system